jgi:hypothetical protein
LSTLLLVWLLQWTTNNTTKSNKSGNDATRTHQLMLQTPLPPSRMVLTVSSSKVQLMKYCNDNVVQLSLRKNWLVVKRQKPLHIESKMMIAGPHRKKQMWW